LASRKYQRTVRWRTVRGQLGDAREYCGPPLSDERRLSGRRYGGPRQDGRRAQDWSVQLHAPGLCDPPPERPPRLHENQWSVQLSQFADHRHRAPAPRCHAAKDGGLASSTCDHAMGRPGAWQSGRQRRTWINPSRHAAIRRTRLSGTHRHADGSGACDRVVASWLWRAGRRPVPPLRATPEAWSGID
jgi:hypothetical protein